MLSGRVAIVTGAAQGIGLATTHLLLRSGAKVGAVDISESLQKTCDELGQEFKKENILCLHCDVTDNRRLRSVFERTKSHFGSLDIIINNAGIGDEVNWQKTVRINLEAVISGTYLALELMSPERGGVVINVSSMGGIYPMPYAPVYSATKHGVIAFTRALKYLKSDGIRINCICPFVVDNALGRAGLDIMPDKYKKEILDLGMITTDKVAEGILQLITDTTKAGAVLRARSKGLSYHIFPEDKPKSKL